ncbi:MAG: methyltransferase [Bradyrhizobium sp.]|nr:MAG: methyltransferase [Bradyrhizobium sp.]
MITILRGLGFALAGVLAAGLCAASAQAADPTLAALVASSDRSPANSARDAFRHPEATLSFFGVKPDSVVVEILPGSSGYWTEILAPYLKERGRYIAAVGDPQSTSEEAQKDIAAFNAKFVAAPERYGGVQVTSFNGDAYPIAAPGSADFVLTFRNIHNWMAAGDAPAAFAAFFKSLKPGGVLGVEEHRARSDQPQDPLAKSGYVREDFAVALAEAAGFKFVGASEINANPKDTKDYSVGVWALPPTYRLKDIDHEKYAAIGESDRFTLKFVKPAP